jgi:hypothetical protein
VRNCLLLPIVFASLFAIAQTAPNNAPAQVAVPQLPENVAVLVDAFRPLNKLTERCPIRTAGWVKQLVRDEFANTEKGRLVHKASEADYALVIVAPVRKEFALLVPIDVYKQSVHWLNPLRGEADLDNLFQGAIWDSTQSVNMGMRYAVAFASKGWILNAGAMKPRQFVVKLKNDMMGGAKHRARTLTFEDTPAYCDLAPVFKGAPPASEPLTLPSGSLKVYFEPLSVAPKYECAHELRVRDNGTMKLERSFEGDSRFQLVRNREDADYIFSLIMFKEKNIAMLVSRENYAQYMEWEDPSTGVADLYSLWSTALWRSNQANQRVKNAGVTLLTYGMVREAGNKSATDLIALFRSEFND